MIAVRRAILLDNDSCRPELTAPPARQSSAALVPIPLSGPVEAGVIGTVAEAEPLEKAREAGDITEKELVKRL
jgi:hypothetical protein